MLPYIIDVGLLRPRGRDEAAGVSRRRGDV